MGQAVEDNHDGTHHRNLETEPAVDNHQPVLSPGEEYDHIGLDHRNSLVEEGSYRGIHHGVDCNLGVVHVAHTHLDMDDDLGIWTDFDHGACQAVSKAVSI